MRAARIDVREAFQASRGIAILIVVIFHADLALASLPHYETFPAVKDALRFIPMPLFFLSVGMSVAPAFERGRAPSHLVRRAVHYGYLYLVWALVDFAITELTTLGAASYQGVLKSFVHPNGSLWFLYGLAAQLALFSLLARFSGGFQVAVALLLVLLANYAHSPLAVSTMSYMIFLVLGARFGPELQRLIADGGHWQFLAYAPLYVALLWMIGQSHSGIASVLAVLASVTGILGLVQLIRWVKGGVDCSLLRFIGRSSFEIYILHSYFISALIRLFAWSGVDVHGSTSLELLLTFSSLATAVCGSLIVSHLIRNVGWLFSKPHWVVARVEPVFVQFVEEVVSAGKNRRFSRLPSSDVPRR